jgi:hypothetical protein
MTSNAILLESKHSLNLSNLGVDIHNCSMVYNVPSFYIIKEDIIVRKDIEKY